MSNHKHLTLDDRSYIHTSLNSGHSFRQIARHLGKDPSTISKEVRHHLMRLATGAVGRIPNKCIHRTDCTVSGLCDKSYCTRSFCRFCKKCNKICSKFKEEHCQLLLKPPYVCNGCGLMHRCVLTKYVYRAIPAHNNYRTNLVGCRVGLSYTEDELQYMDEVFHRWSKRNNLFITSVSLRQITSYAVSAPSTS